MTNSIRGEIRALLSTANGMMALLGLPMGETVKAEIPATEDYNVIRADLVDRLFDAFISFVSSSGAVTRFRNAARKALTEDIPSAFYAGYVDAGGEETENEDERWLTGELNRQLAFMDDTFEGLKEWRESEKFTEADVQTRAETWGRTLDSIYSEGKLRGADNEMLTFDGEDGEESCAECQKYKGKRRSAKWWRDRDLIRRNGNDNFGCGRWENCHHDLFDDDGKLYTR